MAKNPLQQSQAPYYARLAPVMNRQQFLDAIADNGVRLVHFKATPCPVGQVDQYDPRKAHEDHSGCSNGFLYDRAGTLTGLFMGSSNSTQLITTGIYDGSTVQVTFPITYDDSDDSVIIAPYDRIFLDEPQGYVVGQQRFTANMRGVDALQFPIEKVEMLVDSSGKRYHQGQDFTITDGCIRWTGVDRPGTGVVCSVRYLYLPFWYVGRMVHEVRVAMNADPISGVRSIERYPYQAVLHRENFGRDKQSEPGAPLDPRGILPPEETESDLLA